LVALLALGAFLTSCNRPASPTADPPEEPAPAEPLPPSDPAGDHDACLEGQWWSYTHDIDILMATLSPVPNMHVSDGDLVLWFNPDGQYEYQGRVVLHLDMDSSEDQYMETTAFFTTSGPYASRDDATLVLDLSNSRREVLNMKACKNGECVDAPELMPVFDIVPPGAAPYRCSADRLELDTQGPFGPATMFFYK
jgi:hypothetical protein